MHLPFLSGLWSRRLARRDESARKAAFAVESPVRVCFSGLNRGGSWKIRGVQLASARSNWAAIPEPGPSHFDGFDVFCFVKHPDPLLMAKLKERGKLIVLDIVDGWRQPEDDLRCPDLESARQLFLDRWSALPVDRFLFPNRAMAEDFGEKVPGHVLYHHYRPGLRPVPARERARTLAYEGDERFLGSWAPFLARLAQKNGLTFVVNPPDLSQADIGFAGRGGPYDSFLANRYKSNVKLANFLGAGVPCVVPAAEQSCRETAPEGVRFHSSEEDVEAAVLALLDREERERVQQSLEIGSWEYSLQSIAGKAEGFFLQPITRGTNLGAHGETASQSRSAPIYTPYAE